jgi:hypothetical protein
MFVFHRSFWTVAAGLGTALAVLGLNLLLEHRPNDPASRATVAVMQTPSGGPAPLRQAGDISLANR